MGTLPIVSRDVYMWGPFRGKFQNLVIALEYATNKKLPYFSYSFLHMIIQDMFRKIL